MKLCPKCSKYLDAINFYKSSKSKDGLQGYCKSCSKTINEVRREGGYFRDYRTKNADKIAEYRADYRERNDSAIRESSRLYREFNAEKVAESRKKYAKENREKVLESSRAYQKANRHKYAAWASKRRMISRQAEPSWLSCDHKKQIGLIWGLSELKTFVSGHPYEVDHIVPLQSKEVCGLHVPWNLQVVPRSDNRRKRNLHWPDMWEKE